MLSSECPGSHYQKGAGEGPVHIWVLGHGDLLCSSGLGMGSFLRCFNQTPPWPYSSSFPWSFP